MGDGDVREVKVYKEGEEHWKEDWKKIRRRTLRDKERIMSFVCKPNLLERT